MQRMTLLLLFCFLSACPVPTSAQDLETGGKVRINFRELINWLFADSVGTGGYQVGDESALQLRLKTSYRVNKTADDPRWNAIFELKVTLGVHAFKFLEELDLDDETFGAVSVEPEAKFPFHIGREWTVTPFQAFGINDITRIDDIKYTSTTGIRARYAHPTIRALRFLELTAHYGTYLSSNGPSDDDYFYTGLSTEIRSPRFSRWGKKHRPVIVPFAKAGYHFNPLTIEQAGDDPIKIRDQYELGFKFYTEPRYKMIGIKVPRLGISVQFSDEVVAFKVRL
jgi:hypothetical protein